MKRAMSVITLLVIVMSITPTVVFGQEKQSVTVQGQLRLEGGNLPHRIRIEGSLEQPNLLKAASMEAASREQVAWIIGASIALAGAFIGGGIFALGRSLGRQQS